MRLATAPAGRRYLAGWCSPRRGPRPRPAPARTPGVGRPRIARDGDARSGNPLHPARARRQQPHPAAAAAPGRARPLPALGVADRRRGPVLLGPDRVRPTGDRPPAARGARAGVPARASATPPCSAGRSSTCWPASTASAPRSGWPTPRSTARRGTRWSRRSTAGRRCTPRASGGRTSPAWPSSADRRRADSGPCRAALSGRRRAGRADWPRPAPAVDGDAAADEDDRHDQQQRRHRPAPGRPGAWRRDRHVAPGVPTPSTSRAVAAPEAGDEHVARAAGQAVGHVEAGRRRAAAGSARPPRAACPG